MTGLEPVLRAGMYLHGERHAPELPIPPSAIEAYAQRFGMSPVFVGLVKVYDSTLMERMHQNRNEAMKKGGKRTPKPNRKKGHRKRA